MVVRLCQLKSLLFLSLIAVGGCSYNRPNSEHATTLFTSIKPKWFINNPQHALYDQQGKPKPHQFFDVQTELSKKDVFVNAVILTPEDSDHSYDLDVASGQRYYSHSYCAQKDIWNEYSGTINKPTFSIGFIPRILDKMGDPQKVIIFGGGEKYAKSTDFHEHRIRLVGAANELVCPEGKCDKKSSWIPKLIFLATDLDDKKFEQVTNIVTLQEKIDLIQTRAVLENLDGINYANGTNYPSARIGNFFTLREAMDQYKKESIYLTDDELKKIRPGCHALYEKLWNGVGVEQAEDKPSKTVKELNTKLEIIEKLKIKRKPVGFANRLKKFTAKYYSKFNTCQKYVYAGNINLNPDKFWFLSYVGMFYRLHGDGYYFNCNTKMWSQNFLNDAGKPIYDIKTGLNDCTNRDFDRAMEFLPAFLTALKEHESNFYKFVDYDNHHFGTHQKIYSWVKVKSRRFNCSEDPNPEINKGTKVFPDDVSWKARHFTDIANEKKIIY